MKLISVVTPCFNEQENIEKVYAKVKQVFADIKNYRYEHIFIDNASTDNTVEKLKKIATTDSHVKMIVNVRNFGHIRSPYHAILQTQGDAVITLAADLQDPPELIPSFIERWEAGWKIVAAVKPSAKENIFISSVRRGYYHVISRISEIKLIKNFTGFGLYDKQVIDVLRNIDDSYPYFRGLISEIGFPVAEIPYEQPIRKEGKSKNNFYTLYDIAMLGITSHSKLPIRLATIGGFFLSIISFLAAVLFFILKLSLWYYFPVGIAPILIGMFFFASIQLFFIGILGEYILSIHTQTLKRPLVIEKERINFELNQQCENTL